METSLIIDPKETALLVIDMQNGFCHPDGVFARGGHDYIPHWNIVQNVKELVNICRQCGIHAMWSLQIHFPDDVTRRKHKIRSHLDRTGMYPCLKGTWDAELVDDLKREVTARDDVFEKHRASCFYNTNLEAKLRMRGITTLIVSGITTHFCVDSTIRDAYARDYDIIVVEDCVACRHEDLHKATLKMASSFFGLVVSTPSLKEMLAVQT